MEFYQFLILLGAASLISLAFGFRLGTQHVWKKVTNEVRQDIEKKYLKQIEEEFIKHVEIRAKEIAEDCWEKIMEQEKENENESSGSN